MSHKTSSYSRTFLVTMWLGLFPFHCLADEVVIEWAKTPGAAAYELLVRKGRERILNKTFSAPQVKWVGQLPFGEYTYQLRAIDGNQRLGTWSQPIPFDVLPAPPKLTQPADGTIVPTTNVTFNWDTVKSVKHYFLEVDSNSQSIFRKIITGTKFTLPRLKAREYEWRVKPVWDELDAGGTIVSSKILHQNASDTFVFRCQAPATREVTSSPSPSPPSIPPTAVASATTGVPFVEPAPKEVLDIQPKEGSVYLVGGGMMSAYFFHLPFAEVGRMFGSSLALRTQLSYAKDASSTASLSLYGLAVSANYFFVPKRFSGPFAAARLGAYYLSASENGVNEQAITPTFSIAGGWQWTWDSGLHLDLSGGAQYINPPSLTVKTRAKGSLPFFMVSLGYVF